MKQLILVLSLLLTSLVFSMSFVSGAASSTISSGVSDMILGWITNIFPNNQIDIETFHTFIRKAAHVTEFIVLAISWFYTIKLWDWSLGIQLLIGLVIASTDETIQVFAVDRGPSIFDALVYDYLPFMIASLVLWLIYQRKGESIMATDTLARLKDNQISPELAYEELYKDEKRKRIPFFKRAHFIKLKIHVPEEKGVNFFLKVLFFIPFPLFIVKLILRLIKMDRFDDSVPLTKKEMIKLISYKGIIVKVNTKSGEKILIKTI
ncbi:MAG TPA: VanZ family protein [Bacillota bacterium]|nr:VanZ family protein [Bacillota bacterium]